MKKYLISVIVPVYNAETYLKECIESILHQSYQKIELILVDDGSGDGSGAICDSYAKDDERVTVLHRENGGPTAACVAGMEAATGDYYMFVDSDDYVETVMLEEMAALLVGTRGEVICCNHVLEKKKKTVPVYSAVAPDIYVGEALDQEIKARLIGQEHRAIPISRCMKLCERSVFEIDKSYYDYDVRFMEDCHMMYPALMNSTRVVVMREALFYHYRYVESSMVHLYDKGIYESLEKVMAGLRKVVEEKKVPDGEQMLNREYCYMLLYVLKNELRNPDRNYKEKIRKIFCEPKTRELIQTTNLSICERFNALLYLGAQYPEGGIIGILRLMLKVHDR